jgi:hypothetical protein
MQCLLYDAHFVTHNFWTVVVLSFIKKHDVSDTELCLRFQAEPTQVGSIERSLARKQRLALLLRPSE